jgi:DNA-binding GntR family transcriptional regulator
VEDGPAFAACDEELHAMIAQMGPNAILRNLLDQLAEISAHSRAQTSVDIRTRRAGLGPMLRVVDAIVAGDPEGAERAMVDHLRATVAAADTAESVPSAAEGR